MTEAEFLTSTDPAALLSFVCDGPEAWRHQHRASARTLRLFACACVRQAVPRLSRHDEEAIRIVEDTKAGEVNGVSLELWGEVSNTTYQIGWTGADAAANHTIATCLASHATTTTPAGQAAILREIVGNPFRPAAFVWLNEQLYPRPKRERLIGDYIGDLTPVPWLTPLVAQMARTIYDERAFADLPILADALEDAGCTDEAILRHLRGEEPCWMPDDGDGPCHVCAGTSWAPLRGPHVRGCWALDLLLGLE